MFTPQAYIEAPINTVEPVVIEMTIEEKIRHRFGDDAEIMLAIAKCESGLRQFDKDGKVITSHTNDSGLFQINNATWDKKAKELGLDYKNNIDHNIEMAKYILDKQGKNAWKPSQHCWNRATVL